MRKTLRKPELLKTVGLSESTIRVLEKEGNFPKRFPLTARTVGWNADEVEAWMEERQRKAGEMKRDEGMLRTLKKNGINRKRKQESAAC